MSRYLPVDYEFGLDWGSLQFDPVMVKDESEVYHPVVTFTDISAQFHVPVCRPREHLDKREIPRNRALREERRLCCLCRDKIVKLLSEGEIE